MPIESNRLKELRKRKRLSRAQLADRSRISQRQIARLESEGAAANTARDRTVNELARALGVEPGVLTGEVPMPAASTSPHREGGRSRQVSALVQPEVSLAYTLIKRRYGIGLTTLVNAAPLMFMLLAEGSFVWRREKLKEVEEAADHLHDLGIGHLSFAHAVWRTKEGALGEQESIDKRDLFGEAVSEEAFDLGYELSTNNPFADYLRDLASKISEPDIIRLWDFIYDQGTLRNFPEFAICEGDIDKFTGGSKKLNGALQLGLLRVDQMPEELLADDATDGRREWLEERYNRWLAELPDEEQEFWVGLGLASPEVEEAGADS